MPVLGEADYGGYRLGMPGMIATHSANHVRQSFRSEVFVNKLASTNLYFGTAAVINPANGQFDLASVANGQYIGVLLDPGKYADRDYYAPKEELTVGTLGDFWVRVDPAITIVPLVGSVYFIPTAGATLGYYTNVSTNNVIVTGYKFVTKNHNGLAAIAPI